MELHSTQHNDTQHNDTRHNEQVCDTQHNWHSINDPQHNSTVRVIVMLNVIVLSVVMLDVEAPFMAISTKGRVLIHMNRRE